MAGYCRLWILGYAELAKPLYEATKDKAPCAWGPDQQKAFEELKTTLLRALALALPDSLKPFTLFVYERSGIAKGILMQHLGPWKQPVAYLSKRLDPVAAGWSPCLQIIAAVALMVKDADKLTFGQHLKVVTPHAVEGGPKAPSRQMDDQCPTDSLPRALAGCSPNSLLQPGFSKSGHLGAKSGPGSPPT
jgi:hypothetical protein